MGEIAEMMLDGTLCEGCGTFIDFDEPGFTRYCSPQCGPADRYEPRLPRFNRYAVKPSPKSEAGKVKCPVCAKRVKPVGLGDHVRDAHPETQATDGEGLA